MSPTTWGLILWSGCNAKLAPQWANLAAAFDTVKSDIQQINGLQQSGQSTNTNNAATDWAFCGTSTPGAANVK